MKSKWSILGAFFFAACSPADTATQKLEQTSAMPPGLHEDAAAYDASRNRVILFSGTYVDSTAPGGYANTGKTWEWDGESWWLARPDSAGPGPRTVAALAYDADRKRMLMFGGAQGAFDARPEQLNDVWSYDATGWTRLNDGPVAFNARLIYSDADKAMLLVANAGTFPEHEDPLRVSIWRLQRDVWQFVDSSGPRITASTLRPAFDGARNILVIPVFDGPDAGVWEWNGTRWRNVAHAGGITPRHRFVTAYHPAMQRIVLFGGSAGPPHREFADAWTWDGAKWTLIPTEQGPAPRSDGSLITDSGGRRLILIGGYDGNVMFRDAWSLSADGWTRLH